MTLVPADTVTLAGVRFDHLRQTPFYQKLLAIGPSGGLGRFLWEAGLDPNADLWEGLIVWNGKDAAVMLRGKFSAMGLEPNIERSGVQRMPYKGYMLIGDEQLAVTFLNPSTAAAGRAAILRSILDHRSESTGLPKRLEERVKTIEPENQFWAVAIGGLPVPADADLGNWGNFARVLERIAGITIGAVVGDGVVLAARGQCSSPADAETLETALRGLLGLARLSMRDRPALVSLSETIAISRLETTVELHADIPADLLDRLLDEMEQARTR